MKNQDATFDINTVSPAFQMCFLDDCPRCTDCLHFLAARKLPASREWGPAIFPTIKRTEQGCRFFKTAAIKHMAWGFESIFSEVKSKHETGLRAAVKAYLGGHGTYYRYHNGQRMLSPEQQEWIINLFRQAGYQNDLRFDHYADVYDFDEH